MENSNEKASEREDGIDMISEMPDTILHLILSSIPTTEEVVRTSILSTRWRYLWTSIPSIDIDYTRGLDPQDKLDSKGFREFVYWVLLNNSLDLDTFRLWCCNYYDMSTVGRWIHAAVMRKVKSLDLMFCPWNESEDIELPHCLVTCGSLEVLKLCLLGCHLSLPQFTGFPALRVLELTDVCLFGCRQSLPNFTGFPALRVLELTDVGFLKDDLLKYLLESCPLLEDLSLIECRAEGIVISCPNLKNLRIHNQERVPDEELEDDDDWDMCFSLEISCPKLVFLKLTGYVAQEFLFDGLHSLKKAIIHPKDLFSFEEPDYYVFDELYRVEYLSLSLYFVGQCYAPRVDDPISLPNLKTLELTVDTLHMLVPFLTCLPDLESLHLIFPKKVWGLEKWKLDKGETMSILTRHLKKVEFLEFDGGKPELAVACALLEHGNELEEMVFNWGNVERVDERSMETMKEVSKFHKASLIVKVRDVIEQSS